MDARAGGRRRWCRRLVDGLLLLCGGAGEAGHVAVEFALTLPYLVAFMYGLMEVSHYAYLQLTLNNAAHDGARYAIVHSASSAQPLGASAITTYVDNELSALGLTIGTGQNGAAGATVTVTYTPDTKAGSTVQVQISYPFTPFMPGFDAVPGSTATFGNLLGPISAGAAMILGP